jgi:FMN phosphatase YigB (HAD superfamily)
MNDIYKDIDIVIFDVMGVIIALSSLVEEGFVIDTQFWEYRNFLSKKNIRKGILSNMPREWGEYFFEKFNLKNEFDPIVLSGEVGMSKPERGIYLGFEKRSGIALKRSLFIDDKLINLKTAYDLGVKTVYFNRKKKKRNIEGFQPDYEVSSFADLF